MLAIHLISDESLESNSYKIILLLNFDQMLPLPFCLIYIFCFILRFSFNLTFPLAPPCGPIGVPEPQFENSCNVMFCLHLNQN